MLSKSKLKNVNKVDEKAIGEESDKKTEYDVVRGWNNIYFEEVNKNGTNKVIYLLMTEYSCRHSREENKIPNTITWNERKEEKINKFISIF